MADQKVDDMQNPSPANAPRPRVSLDDIIPMSAPTLKLEAPKKAGWHRHWFRGTPDRLQRAYAAGYSFVDPEDVSLNNFDLGGDAKKDGNSDMGSRVSRISGEGTDAEGQPLRMYLMECPLEYYHKSKSILEETNRNVADALTAGALGKGAQETGETATDIDSRTVKATLPDFFNPNKRKRV